MTKGKVERPIHKRGRTEQKESPVITYTLSREEIVRKYGRPGEFDTGKTVIVNRISTAPKPKQMIDATSAATRDGIKGRVIALEWYAREIERRPEVKGRTVKEILRKARGM